MEPITLPGWLDDELWQEWIDYRRQDKKKPATDRSLRMTLKKLERLRIDGFDGNLLIEMAIEREWQGIHAHESCKRIPDARSAAERVRQNALSFALGQPGGDVRGEVHEPVRRNSVTDLGDWTQRKIGG